MRSLQQMLEANQRGKWMLDLLDRVFNDFPYHLEWGRGLRENVKPEVIAYRQEQDRQMKERRKEQRKAFGSFQYPKRTY